MQTKTCSKCQETKPVSEFYPDKSRPDGYSSWCKDCRRADERERRREFRAQNPLPPSAPAGGTTVQKTCSKCGRGMSAISLGRHEPVCRADEGLKVCSRCGEAKPFEEFYKSSQALDGYDPRCKPCKLGMEASPEARARDRKRKREKHDTDEEYRSKQRETRRAADRRLMDEIRERLGGKCVWPGCGSTENLEIDHVNDDGWEHRTSFPHDDSGSKYYRAIRDELRAGNLTRELQLLCRRHHGEKRRLKEEGVI